MNARKVGVSILVWSCAVLALGLCGSAAQAALRHEYLSQITEVPAGPGVGLSGPLYGAGSMEVNSGKLTVVEKIEGTDDERVDNFDDASGAFVSQLTPTGVPAGFEYMNSGGALSSGTGDLYIPGKEGQEGRLGVFGAAGAFVDEWNGAATPAGTFGEVGVQGVAVDNSPDLNDWAKGDVYIGDGGSVPSDSEVPPQNEQVVDVFEPEASGGEKYVTQITGTEPGKLFGKPSQVVVDRTNGDLLVVDYDAQQGDYVVDIFEPSALDQYVFVRQLTGSPAGPFTRHLSVAVDSTTGEIYIATEEEGIVDEFSFEGKFLGEISGAGSPDGPFKGNGTEGGKGVDSIAVDPESGWLYVYTLGEEGSHKDAIDVFGPDKTVPDVKVTGAVGLAPASATLTGTVNPDEAGEATCEFEYGTTTSYGQRVPCSAHVPNGGAPVAVQAQVTELQPDTTYYYRLDASNASGSNNGEGGSGETGEFTTTGPGMDGESAADVAATSATLQARIDPHGDLSEYYFQYGTTSAYGTNVPAPPGSYVGSGEGAVEVGEHLQGLAGATPYHFRVVVTSEVSPGNLETFDGPDQTFVTQAGGGVTTLPDGREWEMVSPVNKHGALIHPINSENLTQAAASGNAFTYNTSIPTEIEEPPGNPTPTAVQELAVRGPSGWQSQTISTAHESALGAYTGDGDEYRFFSTELSLALVMPMGPFTSLSPEDSERTVYLRHDATCAASPETCYQPLVTGAPGYANVPPGTKFGGNLPLYGDVELEGATADVSHVVLSSMVGLSTTADDEGGLYEWTGGKLELASVLPEGEGPAKLAVVPTLGYFGSEGGSGRGSSRQNAISANGSRIVWSERTAGEHLYLRDMVKQETIRLDVVQPGASGAGGPAQPLFQVANSEGSRVFFTDEQRLTENSHASPKSPDLYECEIVEVAGKLKCDLNDLTPDATGERGDALGMLGISEDGSYVYFVANRVLAPGASPGGCTTSFTPGVTCNLYVRHDGVTTFVADLSGEDAPDWASLNTRQTAKVTSDGRFVAFMSDRSLTGYDNRDAVSGMPDEEVFQYDAVSKRIVCVSCNPTGARPSGVRYESNDETLYAGDRVWDPTQWIAANIPMRTPYWLSDSQYQSRYLAGDGLVFFNSNDALVPQDVNGTQDVYEYEPPGIGDCTTGSTTFSHASGGCVNLISSGTSGEESAFLDASEEGHDVFFLTSTKLVPQDVDSALDVYDAHECSSVSPCPPPAAVTPPPCDTGDACKPAPTPQPSVYGAPSSETFSGAGNVSAATTSVAVKAKSQTQAQKLARALKACHKKSRQKRKVCEKRAKTRFKHGKSADLTAKKARG